MYPPGRCWTARASGRQTGRKSVLSLCDCMVAKYTGALADVKLPQARYYAVRQVAAVERARRLTAASISRLLKRMWSLG